MLIEMVDDMFLIGIGCNVMTAPDVASLRNEAGRASTCLADHSALIAQDVQRLSHSVLEEKHEEEEILPDSETVSGDSDEYINTFKLKPDEHHKDLAIAISRQFYHWLSTMADDNENNVLEDFQRNMDFSPQTLRDSVVGSDQPNVVIPVALNADGTLRVSYYEHIISYSVVRFTKQVTTGEVRS